MISAAEFVSQFADSARPIHLIGEGLVYYRELFETEGVEILDERLWYPKAQCVYELARKKAMAGEFADAATFVPSYIRQPDAIENLRKRKNQARTKQPAKGSTKKPTEKSMDSGSSPE